MPNVNLVLALVRQFLCIRRIAMTLAASGHVVLQRPIVVVPPRRRGERKVPHGLAATCLGGFQERGGIAACRVLPAPERSAFGGWLGLPPAHFGQRHVPVSPQQPAPVAQARFETHVIDGAPRTR